MDVDSQASELLATLGASLFSEFQHVSLAEAGSAVDKRTAAPPKSARSQLPREPTFQEPAPCPMLPDAPSGCVDPLAQAALAKKGKGKAKGKAKTNRKTKKNALKSAKGSRSKGPRDEPAVALDPELQARLVQLG
eukprot:12031406-Alexandrium_andersonii.AAC.1